MLFRPGASREAGMQTIASRSAFHGGHTLLAVAALLMTVGPTAFAADQAQDVMRKMGDVYRNAKSFSGSVTIHQNGKGRDGKPFSATTVQQTKYKSPNLFLVDLKVNSAAGAGKKQSVAQTIASDGKAVTIWISLKNQYVKQPAPPTLSLPQLFALMHIGLIPMPNQPLPGLTSLPQTTVQGRAAYVLQIAPPAQGIAKPPPLHLMIDKQNYHLLKVTQSGNGSSIEIAFASQTLNGAVAQSAFNFHPPAGAKQVTPQPQAPGMMPPGAGGLPPRHP